MEAVGKGGTKGGGCLDTRQSGCPRIFTFKGVEVLKVFSLMS